MISVREHVTQQVAALSEIELQQVANYLAFLRFEKRVKQVPQFDEAELAVLYGEFAEEDRDLAETGMGDYAAALEREDIQ